MKLRILWILGLATLLSSLDATATPDDCDHPFAYSSEYKPQQLRQVAKECTRTEVANLFYNRAYHTELLQKFQLLNRLHSLQPSHDLTHYHTQRIYIALSEAFARRAWRQGESQALQQLNRQYDRSIEIAEYQLKGYDVLAARSRQKPSEP